MTNKFIHSLGGKIIEMEDKLQKLQQKIEENFVASIEREAILEAERDYLEIALQDSTKNKKWNLARPPHYIQQWFAQSAFPVKNFKVKTQAFLARHKLEAESGFRLLVFDKDFYRHQASDAPDDNDGALSHYLSHGEAAGLWPSKIFNPDFYAQQIPGLVTGQGRALLHFLEHGLILGWSPCPEIDRIALRAKLAKQTIPAWLHGMSSSI